MTGVDARLGSQFGARLLARAAALGQRRAAALTEGLADRLAEEEPGIALKRGTDGLEVQGRGLTRRRWLSAALRWPGGLVR